jgi:hypothetical protein
VKRWAALSILCSLPAIAQYDARPAFDRGQSAALFVGVQHFTRDRSVAEVLYAVDDAVDLAYALSLDPGISLVQPQSVALALSGEAMKAESRLRLSRLVDAGATVAPATRDEVLALLHRQADRAGRDGMLIVSIASHGFSSNGVPYVLTSTSLGQQPETALATGTVLDIVSTSRAERSLIFLDACREQETPRSRAAPSDLLAAPPLIDGMARANGHVLLAAAPAGQYAYDDEERKNGVFTTAVIDALQCKARPDARGLLTVEALSTYVDEHVRTWERIHRHLAGGGIQIQVDGDARRMPLAVCARSW